MPQVPIIMPQLGESIAEATIVDIKVKPGDEVAPDQEIFDVETNKAVMGVTTPCKGKSTRSAVQLKELIQWARCWLRGSELRRCSEICETSSAAASTGSRGGNSSACRSRGHAGAREKNRCPRWRW